MLLPVVLWEIGGLSGMRATIAGADFNKDMLSLVAPGNIGVFYIAMLSINTLFLIVAMPSVMGNCAAGKTEMDGRVGFMFGTFLKRICTIAWCLTAVAALAWYLQNGIDLATIKPDEVYGDVAHRFLPRLLPGMLGIFIASLLAAVMSSCDSFMIASSGLFTENIYKPFAPKQSQTHYIWVGRVVSILVVLAGVAVAYALPGVIAGLKIWYKVVPMMDIAFWMGLVWRRATVAGAWASAISGFAIWGLVTRGFFVEWAGNLSFSDTIGLVAMRVVNEKDVFEIYEPWQITFYLGGGLLAGVIVSLLTKRVDSGRLDRFFALTRTPVQPDEEIEEPCSLPKGVEPANHPMLISAFDLEIPVPSWNSAIGFFVGWVCIAALIAAFVLVVAT